jgi:hypothetical protein
VGSAVVISGLVVASVIDGELAEEFAGGVVDDADVEVADERINSISVARAADVRRLDELIAPKA